MMVQTVFWILAGCTVLAAIGCVTSRHPIASVMWLVGAMFGLAAIYLLHGAQFIAAVQVLVYAGAVMVLFLFVIMLLNLGSDTSDIRHPVVRLTAAGVGLLIMIELAALAFYSPGRVAAEARKGLGAAGSEPVAVLTDRATGIGEVVDRGVVGALAEPMFTTYLIPFEITSVLLIAAAVGAVVLAKRKL